LFHPAASKEALKAAIDPFEFNEFSLPNRKTLVRFVSCLFFSKCFSPEKRLKHVMNKLRQEKEEQGIEETLEEPPKEVAPTVSLRQQHQRGIERLLKFNFKKRKKSEIDLDCKEDPQKPQGIICDFHLNLDLEVVTVPVVPVKKAMIQETGWLTPHKRFCIV
jgi:hypothetical protein